MPLYLDTRGHTTLAIGICARCKCKYPLDELRPDPNYPGLRCCPDGCLDSLDPWTLPPRATEDISVEYPRPDTPLSPGPVAVYANQLEAAISPSLGLILEGTPLGFGLAAAPPVTAMNPSNPWSASTSYALGAQVTAANPVAELPGLAAAELIFYVFTCIAPGLSGTVAPTWPTQIGVGVTDGQAVWINAGLYLP